MRNLILLVIISILFSCKKHKTELPTYIVHYSAYSRNVPFFILYINQDKEPVGIYSNSNTWSFDLETKNPGYYSVTVKNPSKKSGDSLSCTIGAQYDVVTNHVQGNDNWLETSAKKQVVAE